MRYFLILTCVVGSILIIIGCGTTVNRESELQLISLKSKCREDGEKTRAEWKKTYFQDTFADEPEYSYNPTLKTCLWLGEYRGPAGIIEPTTKKAAYVQTHVKFILDVYTNKTIIEYTEHDGKQIGDVTEATFNQRKAELFTLR
jgi:hypothetical protein